MLGIVLATTYAVMRFTVPAFESPGNCMDPGIVPETRLAYCWLEHRREGEAQWLREWKVGVQGSNGLELVIGVPKDGPTWFRIVPVDSAGLEPICPPNEVLIP